MRANFFSAGVAFLTVICLMTGCKSYQTEYFGVEDEAIYTPKEFHQTRETIESAKETADSVYAEKKIYEAMELGEIAAITYWSCFDQEAKGVLAMAQQSAYRAELFHPQPLPPTPRRTSNDPLTPDSPETLEAAAPFAGLKALPPPMILSSMDFDFNSAKVRKKYEADLENQGTTLKNHPDFRFEIAGHTDSVGSDAYNQKLSTKRAKSVSKYLAAKGVPDNYYSSIGYGESVPITSNATKAGQAENRRTETRVIGSLLPDSVLTDLNVLPAGTTIEIINFNYSEHQLLPIYRSLLDKLIPVIIENPNVRLEIGGYSDAIGAAKHNVPLSLKRAKNVKDYLVSHGVPASSLTTTVYATSHPITTNETSIGRGFNRRVEIKIME
jgi:outer membrane protein OmpA-like peptidoglycan-associated protein